MRTPLARLKELEDSRGRHGGDDAAARQFRTEVKWHAFVYRSWHLLKDAITAVYGDVSPDSAVWQHCRSAMMGGIRRYQWDTIERAMVFIRNVHEQFPGLAQTSRVGMTAHLKTIFSRDNFSAIFQFMDGWLDWDGTQAKSMGAYALKVYFLSAGAAAHDHITAGAKSKDSRAEMIKNYATLPLHHQLARVRREHFVVMREKSVRERESRERDISNPAKDLFSDPPADSE